MELLTFVLTAIAAYLGIVGGYFLSLIAPEELKKGKKYFKLIAKMILLIIIMLIIIFLGLNPFIDVYLALLVIIWLFIKRYLRTIYPLTAVALFLFKDRPELFVIIASLIFMFGLTAASLFMLTYIRKDKIIGDKLRIFLVLNLKSLLFIVVAVLFYFF